MVRKEDPTGGQEKPEIPKRSYPGFVGVSPIRRRLYDVGLEATAKARPDSGETVSDEQLAKCSLRVIVAVDELARLSGQEPMAVADSLYQGAINRGLIHPSSTAVSEPPATRDVNLSTIDLEKETRQLLEEMQQPRYPDELEDENGRKFFDKAVDVAGVAARRKFGERGVTLMAGKLAEAYPVIVLVARGEKVEEVSPTDFWRNQIIEEAAGRGKISEEDAQVLIARREMDEGLPSRTTLFSRHRRQRG